MAALTPRWVCICAAESPFPARIQKTLGAHLLNPSVRFILSTMFINEIPWYYWDLTTSAAAAR